MHSRRRRKGNGSSQPGLENFDDALDVFDSSPGDLDLLRVGLPLSLPQEAA